MKGTSSRRGLKGRILEKSIEAYILSLETINRLSIKYRIETFAYLICNAWELLLKAKIIHNTRNKYAIYYKTEKDKPPRSLALRDCLKKVFLNENDPTRRNVERVADLRDESVHLVISQVPKDVLALFQACVLNYHRRLVDWFGISLSERVSIGMMTIVYDFNPDQFDLKNPVLRQQLGRNTAEYLTQFQAEVRREFENLGKPAEFSMNINYKLALVQKPGEADIVLTKGEVGTTTRIVEVPKDPCKTHPYRRREVVNQINSALHGKINITAYDIQCIVEVYQVKKRPEFYYEGMIKGSPLQYSHAFVEWILKQYTNNIAFFEQTRQKVRSKTVLS